VRLTLPGLVFLAACSPPGEGGSRAPRALDTAASAAPARRAPPPATPVLPVASDSSVSWQRLTALVRAAPDSVLAVHQSHDRAVSVQFRDGRRYHATEPALDAIIRLLKEVDPAGRILIATE